MTNDERHALFVTVASRVADRNLAPFYDALGFPVSDATRAAVAAYPELEQRIWDNVDSTDRVVEYLVPGYDPPVGVVEPVVGPVPVGRRVVEAPDVTGLGTASGQGSATVVDATAAADVVGDDTGRLAVRLRSSDGTEDSIVLTTAAVGADSVVARGQSNRPVGVLWLDGAPERSAGVRRPRTRRTRRGPVRPTCRSSSATRTAASFGRGRCAANRPVRS